MERVQEREEKYNVVFSYSFGKENEEYPRLNGGFLFPLKKITFAALV